MTEQRTAEAIVVGAGVVGAAIAHALTARGIHNVLLLDKGTAGGAASGRSGALVRAHYSNAPEAALALAAQRWFHNWEELIGGPSPFTKTGFFQFVGPHDLGKLRENVTMLARLGVNTRLIGADEIESLAPQLYIGEREVAAYEPDSGYADPGATVAGLVAAAQRGGATLREGVAVTALRVAGGRVIGVETDAGPLDAPLVILANGGWSVGLARPLGIDLPIHPVRVQIAFLERAGNFPRGRAGGPTIIDRANGFYARPQGEGETLVGLSGFHDALAAPGEDPAAMLDGYDRTLDPAFPALAAQQVGQRIPSLLGARTVRGHAGPLDVTADGKAIIDRAPGIDGLYLAVGMSGSGFKKAPAIGACVAELVTEGAATTAPIAPFRLARFAEGDPILGNDYSLPEGLAAQLKRNALIH
jgi:sarcosine oxidase subunit beta